jgi:hypothetical protein
MFVTPILALVIGACSAGGAGTAPPTGGTSSPPVNSPTTTPDFEVLDHATGATDVVLRYEEGGGFMMAGFAATMVPHFTLYGDGTIVFRDPTVEFPPFEGSVTRSNPMRTASLSEEQIQDLLAFALGEGGLAAARPEYRYDLVADASTAIFTIEAAGTKKTVSVYALGMDDPTMPDAPARAAFLRLAQQLTGIEGGGLVEASDYVPPAYRGILLEAQGLLAPDIRAWPWDDIAPSDFVADADPNGIGFPHRTMTAAEVEALGLAGYEGGLANVPLTGPDGTTYTFSLRPLLPDEIE